MHLPSARSQVLRYQHYHLQWTEVCIKTKLVILPRGEKSNLPNPIPYEDSIATDRVYWKIALELGGWLAASTQHQKKKKNLKDAEIPHRCCCCMGKLLSATQKSTIRFRTEGLKHMQITDRMRLILSPTALQSESGRWGKELEICSLLDTVEKSLGEEKREKAEEQVFPFSCFHD